jgi:hypothetical protein
MIELDHTISFKVFLFLHHTVLLLIRAGVQILRMVAGSNLSDTNYNLNKIEASTINTHMSHHGSHTWRIA